MKGRSLHIHLSLPLPSGSLASFCWTCIPQFNIATFTYESHRRQHFETIKNCEVRCSKLKGFFFSAQAIISCRPSEGFFVVVVFAFILLLLSSRPYWGHLENLHNFNKFPLKYNMTPTGYGMELVLHDHFICN